MNSLIKFFKVEDLRKKVFFTLFIIFVFRIGCMIPTPGVNIDLIRDIIKSNDFFALYDMFSGNGMSSFAIFALGIGPYITASIILQLLTVGFEGLKEYYEGGEVGKKKQKLHTKILGIFLAFFQASAISLGFISTFNFLSNDNPWFVLVPIFSLTMGAFIVMLLADLIDKKGFGNGVSLMIFVSIVSRIPKSLIEIIDKVSHKEVNILLLIGVLICLFLLIALTVFVQEAFRKIPIEYAKRVSGTKLVGNAASHMPLKLNQGGVMPVIFASTILAVPQIFTMLNIESLNKFLSTWLTPSTVQGLVVYLIIQTLLIFAFTQFTLLTMFNLEEICDNLKKQGGFVPGIRPGKPTYNYLSEILNKLNFVGALFLIFIASLPIIVSKFISLPVTVGGTSLLIAVGVSIDLVKKAKTEANINTYRGFLN